MKKILLYILCAASFFIFDLKISAAQGFIIDPGHGGADSGAVGVGGIYEKDLNLDVSLILRDLLYLSGQNYVFTRDTDDDTDGNPTGFQKKQDIHNRENMASENSDIIFVSIHMNLSTSLRDKGFQVFYSQKNEESIAVAQKIYDAFNKSQITNRMREVKKAPSNVYLMNSLTVPAVLVECGFISNAEDCALLCEKSYRQKVALILFSALCG